MKNFLKENWFKVVLLFLFVVVIVTTFYYLMVFVPQKDQAILEINQQKELEVQTELNSQKQVIEKEATVAKKKSDTIASYRETCSNSEKKNSQSVESAMESLRVFCNKEDDPLKCMKQGMQQVADNLLINTGQDYIQTCVNNMIKKYGTN